MISVLGIKDNDGKTDLASMLKQIAFQDESISWTLLVMQMVKLYRILISVRTRSRRDS